ncbi:Snf7-domain-containing protein [Cladochytrium replicatum]|nr:Snf7-domain-containing protein [Cladochytrium replicatum]
MGSSGSKPSNTVTAKDKAILDLKIQRDKIRQYQKKLQTAHDKALDDAKKHQRNGDRQRALIALKKKKYQEQLLVQTDQQLLNLEQLTSSIEYALVEQDIVKGLQKGTEVLKEINKAMSLEEAEKLMDETADAIAYQREVGEVLGGKITEEDEEEIQEELDRLLEDEQQAIKASLPAVPNTALPELETEPEQPTKVAKLKKEKNKARLEEPMPA